MTTFPLKTWVPVWCIIENYTNPPCDPIPKSGTAIEMVSYRKACLFCSKPASTFTVGSFFLQSPILDCTWSKPASGPEFPAPLNPMLPEAFSLRPLLFPQPTCSSSVHVLPFSLLLSHPPHPPHSLCGPQNLVVPHLRLHPFSLMCKDTSGFIL